MSTAGEKKEEKKINLRDLDDVACSNVVVSRQIRHLVRKNQSFSDIAIDCWVHGGHYTRFKCKNDKFHWYSEDSEPHEESLQEINHKTDCLYNDEWNKLIVFTHRAMCDSLNGVDIEDTPEDLLAFAESKLQEILNDEESTDTELKPNISITQPNAEGLFHKMVGHFSRGL